MENLTEAVDIESTQLVELVKSNFPPLLEQLANSDSAFPETLFKDSISDDAILDSLSFPTADASIYLLVRTTLEKKYIAWLLDNEHSDLLPGQFRRREGGDRFAAEREARRRAQADYSRRFKEQP